MKKTIFLYCLTLLNITNLQTIKAQSKSTIFKGQILDKETKDPIPFVTILSKNDKIYRVTDENGFYRMPIDKNSVLEISSIGYETHKTQHKDLKTKTYLIPKIEQLDEVVISSSLSPKTILERAIKKKKENHPIKPFNFYRYGNVIINNGDKAELDLELITKDFDYGYLSEYVITQRVEQIKWNTATRKEKLKNSATFFSYRQNAIRYANILHRRKFKKFELKLVKSDDKKYEDCYTIAFKTEKNNWRFTNKSYPTNYSGFVYIHKENYAIIKVVENWTSSFLTDGIRKHFLESEQEKGSINSEKINELSKIIIKDETIPIDEIEKYFKNKDRDKKTLNSKKIDELSKITIKEENICEYSNVLSNNKFYATRFFRRIINEATDKKGNKGIRTYETDSYLFDFETKDVEEIEYYQYNNKRENSLHRVEYDKSFWNTFYKRKIKK